ncbi:MAG: winged helix-turn-helix domain-containing protein [Gammaproteobacteria bacterium]
MSSPGELPSERVARELRARLDAGEWGPGGRLPSIGTLTAEYGVSRATVVKALKVLISEDRIVTRSGWGTFRRLFA